MIFECLTEINTHHHSDRAVFAVTGQRSWFHGHRGHGNVMKPSTVIGRHLSSAIYLSKFRTLSLTYTLIQMEMEFIPCFWDRLVRNHTGSTWH